jgi:phage terminase small subunit
MEIARRKPGPSPLDDHDAVGDACTAKQDTFARVWAETGNQSAAYRKAYDVHPDTLPGTVWSNASRIAALPCVRRRYEEIRQQLALETVISVRDALQWQLDIATADPNEIAYIAKRACRHCYGVEHRYQWTDDDEYLAACVAAIDGKKDCPSDAGGYGYTRAKDPVATCPHCLGNGVTENVLNDTRNLSGKARKLYKGVDIKNGELVVLMHDQKAAWEMVCRMLGAFNDKLDLRTPADRAAAAKMPDDVGERDAARAYLAMLS